MRETHAPLSTMARTNLKREDEERDATEGGSSRRCDDFTLCA